MGLLTIQSFAKLCGGCLHHIKQDTNIHDFVLNSKDVTEKSIFIAVKGAHVDGNDFSKEAIDNGAVAILTEQKIPYPSVVVENIVDALALLGKNIRNQMHCSVVGITGSNGKTSTKEFIYQALSSELNIIKSEGNKNTEYTSPLIWTKLQGNEDAVIAELAMRGFHQIEHLCKIHRPNIGVITMIGSNHTEKVGSMDGVAEAKSELLEALQKDDLAILPRDDVYYSFLRSKANCRVMTFGFSKGSDLRVLRYEILNHYLTEIEIELDQKRMKYQIPFMGKHQVLNASAALLVAHQMGVNIDKAMQSIKFTKLPGMRSEIVKLQNGIKCFLDVYNSSPDSVVAAIDVLNEVKQPGKKFAVLGDMYELGSYEKQACITIGEKIAKSCLDGIALYGLQSHHIAEYAWLNGYPREKVLIVSSMKEITEYILSLHPEDLILLKASRGVGLERAVENMIDQ